MQPALIDQNSVAITVDDFVFTASGATIRFPGFMALYMSADHENEEANRKKESALPKLTEGMSLSPDKVVPKQHFTQPPPRFSEASLVKELEENGIGRPSTYAAILSTIRGKGYVDLVRGYFKPSELGFIVNDLLVANFPDVFDVDFTARLEDHLDRIETGDAKSQSLLSRFHGTFQKELDTASEKMLSMRGVGMDTGQTCPECGKHNLHIKVGRNGHYLACNGYPDCTYSRNYTRDEKGQVAPVELPKDEVSDKLCEKCGRAMVVKQGRFGPFLACSGYPECKNTLSINGNGAGAETGVACPEKGCTGMLVEKRSKRGKVFYGCNRFPDCNFATWDKPVARTCPLCQAPILVEKVTKKSGTFVACLDKSCGFKEKA